MARRQGAWPLECLALLTRARILRETSGPEDAVHDDLTAALAVVQETGAATYEPFIREELGRLKAGDNELREALRLFTAIGAPGQARRLETELAASPPRH